MNTKGKEKMRKQKNNMASLGYTRLLIVSNSITMDERIKLFQSLGNNELTRKKVNSIKSFAKDINQTQKRNRYTI